MDSNMSTQVLVDEDSYADAVLIRILIARSAVPIQITKLNWENKRQGARRVVRQL
jgi:hypothetical protein